MKIDELSFKHCLALCLWIIQGHKLLLANISANVFFFKAGLCENNVSVTLMLHVVSVYLTPVLRIGKEVVPMLCVQRLLFLCSGMVLLKTLLSTVIALFVRCNFRLN